MNGEGPQVNGQHLLNGATSTQHHQATEAKISRVEPAASHGKAATIRNAESYTNGVLPNGPTAVQSSAVANGLEQAPLEILQLIGREHYLPLSTMINRTAQNCWNRLSDLVEHLSTISVPQQAPDPSRPQSQVVNNQSKANLDKKDRILNFASDQKANFIKLLVLLQWSRNGENVTKTMNLNFWLMNRRWVYMQARDQLADLKQEAPNFQIPNPDIKTAGEVLSLGKASSFPDIGYQVVKPLKRKQILSTLRKLNRTVSIRLALEESLPPELQKYRIQDGRATFVVEDELELDLSVLEESPTASFRVVDFRFIYSPRPSIPDNKRQEIEFVANSEIDRNGLAGCYDFFHNLTLTTKLTELYKQASELSRNQWAGYLRAEVLRRDLVVEYWCGRDTKKSWIEISIHSGRKAGATDEPIHQSHLAIRWFRDGKEVTEFDLDMDMAEISFASILLQVVAQHINCILDSVYDRLTNAALFNEGGLLVEQSTSTFEPQDCVLEIQMTKNMKVAATIDPVTGSIMLSPASDRANRLQSELNRSRVKGEDLVPRLLNYRCALAEESMLRGVRDTCWQRLDAFTPVANEVRLLFGASTARVNFFRHPLWSSQYLLAITNNINGDRIWILHQSAQGKAGSLTNFSIIQEQPLRLHNDISAPFFAAFADYASGVVVLHSNAEQLNKISPCYRLQNIPEFEDGCNLPVLSFEIADGKISLVPAESDKDATTASSALAGTVRVTSQNIDPTSNSASISVELRCQMEATVLERLAASNPDADLTFAPAQRRISLVMPTVIGESAVDRIVQRVTRLNDVLSCIRTVQTLSSTTLESVSMTAMTLTYKFDENSESRMVVRFPSLTEAPRLDFLPPGVDPHECLLPQFSQLLADSRKSFSANLSSALSSLSLIHPLIMALDGLQKSTQQNMEGNEKSDAHFVRLHVLVRQPTMFGLRFFASSAKGLVENPTASYGLLLARFEILPSSRHNGQWLLRPAIEEVNDYTRSSFAAKSLREKVKEEIFAKKGPCPDWIRLDVAAVCLKSKPHALLNTLHGLMVDWVNSNQAEVDALPPADQPVKKMEQLPSSSGTNMDGNSNLNRKPSGQPLGQPSKPQPNSNTRTNNQPKAKNMGTKPPPKNKEVITLD